MKEGCEEEDPLVLACSQGNVDEVATYLLNKDNYVDADALVQACAQGHEDVVELLLKDSRVDPRAQRNSAFGAAIYHKRLALMQRLLPLITLDEEHCYEIALNHSYQLDHLYPFLVKHSKTAPLDALYAAKDIVTLRVLLDKPRVTLSITVFCYYIINKRVDLLRVLADTPWLGFSRRALAHIQSVAEKHKVPHVFPTPTWTCSWEDEENLSRCRILHGERHFHYSKSNSTVLAVVWCMHQVKMGWADIAEPTIERLHPVVVLELDNEGPLLGIPGAPGKPAFWGVRLMLSVAGIAFVSIAWGLFFIPHDKFNPIASMLFFCAGCAMVATVYFGPSQPHKKQN